MALDASLVAAVVPLVLLTAGLLVRTFILMHNQCRPRGGVERRVLDARLENRARCVRTSVLLGGDGRRVAVLRATPVRGCVLDLAW